MNRKLSITKKEILYLFCFLGFNLIEWLKGTQPGNIWMVAENCTGFLVFVLILSAIPKEEWKKPLAAVLAGAGLIASIVVAILWYRLGKSFLLWKYITAVWNVVWMAWVGAIYFMQLRKKERKLKRPGPLGILWLGLTVLMLFSGSDLIWGVWYFGMFGLFFLTEYTKEDREALVKGMLNGTLIAAFLMQAFAWGFRPYDEVRYKGAYDNCNVQALYYLIVYGMLILKLHFGREERLLVTRNISQAAVNRGKSSEKRYRWIQLLWLICAGAVLSQIFLTQSRTAVLCVVLLTLIYGADVWMSAAGAGSRQNAARAGRAVGSMAAIGVCTIVLFFPVYLADRWLPVILHHPIWFEGEWSEDKVHSFDPADSDKYVSFHEIIQTATGRFGAGSSVQEGEELDESKIQESKLLEEAQNQKTEELGKTENAEMTLPQEPDIQETRKEEREASSQESIEMENTAENNTEAEYDTALSEEEPGEQEQTEEQAPGDDNWSSGRIRIEIWKKYLQNLKIRGHKQQEGYFQITPSYHAWHAQNLWIQCLYYFGVPAGILWLLLSIALPCADIKRYLKKAACRKYGLVPIVFIILFLGFGTLEVVWNPGQLILCLAYLVHHPMFDEMPEEIAVD